MLFGQNQSNVFMSFSEFKENKASEHVSFNLKHRTGSDVAMTGGITNYRVKKIVPSSKKRAMKKEVWAIVVDGAVYINSYPYAGMFGYDKIIETGYYTYFIGSPSISRDKQVKLGIIKKGESIKQPWGRTGYVIKPDGTVKWLNPNMLKELISDDKNLLEEIDTKELGNVDIDEMFDILHRYNKNKN